MKRLVPGGISIAAVVSLFCSAGVARSGELSELRDTVEAQGMLIETLRDELRSLRDEQIRSQDRLRAMEEARTKSRKTRPSTQATETR